MLDKQLLEDRLKSEGFSKTANKVQQEQDPNDKSTTKRQGEYEDRQ